MGDSFASLQSKRSQFGAGGFVVRVKNASNPQTFCDLDEERGVFDIDNLPRGCLGDVQRQLKNICVRFSETNEAGGNESIHKPAQLELANPMRIQFLSFIADDDNLQSILCLEPAN